MVLCGGNGRGERRRKNLDLLVEKLDVAQSFMENGGSVRLQSCRYPKNRDIGPSHYSYNYKNKLVIYISQPTVKIRGFACCIPLCRGRRRHRLSDYQDEILISV